MHSAHDRDRAHHAVEDEQEDRHDREAREAGGEALVERLLAERRGDLRARDEVELERQRADLQQPREVLRGLDREAARDLGALRAVDAVGVLAEVDVRRRDQLVVEPDREVVRRPDRVLQPAVERRVVGAALGDLARRLGERAAALVGELHRDDRRAAAAVLEVLLRVLDVRAAEHRVVEHHPPLVDLALVLLLRRAPSSLRSTTTPSGTSRIFACSVRPCASRSSSRSAAVLLRDAVVDRLVRLLAERVEEPVVGVVVVDDRVALRRLVDRVEQPVDRLLAAVDRLRVGLAVGVEDVRLPVVEEHLRRRADLALGALGVLDAREAHVDLARRRSAAAPARRRRASRRARA